MERDLHPWYHFTRFQVSRIPVDILKCCMLVGGVSQVVLVVKSLPVNAGDTGSIPGLGRSPGGGHENTLQYSCWRIPWTVGPGELQFIRLRRVRHDWSSWAHVHTHMLTGTLFSFAVHLTLTYFYPYSPTFIFYFFIRMRSIQRHSVEIMSRWGRKFLVFTRYLL